MSYEFEHDPSLPPEPGVVGDEEGHLSAPIEQDPMAGKYEEYNDPDADEEQDTSLDDDLDDYPDDDDPDDLDGENGLPEGYGVDDGLDDPEKDDD